MLLLQQSWTQKTCHPLGHTFCWDHSSMNTVRHFQRGPGYWVWGAGVTGRSTVPTPQGLVLWPCHMNPWRYVPGVGQGDPLPWSVLKFQPSLLDASMHLFSESMVWTALLTFNLPILKVYNLRSFDICIHLWKPSFFHQGQVGRGAVSGCRAGGGRVWPLHSGLPISHPNAGGAGVLWKVATDLFLHPNWWQHGSVKPGGFSPPLHGNPRPPAFPSPMKPSPKGEKGLVGAVPGRVSLSLLSRQDGCWRRRWLPGSRLSGTLNPPPFSCAHRSSRKGAPPPPPASLPPLSPRLQSALVGDEGHNQGV